MVKLDVRNTSWNESNNDSAAHWLLQISGAKLKNYFSFYQQSKESINCDRAVAKIGTNLHPKDRRLLYTTNILRKAITALSINERAFFGGPNHTRLSHSLSLTHKKHSATTFWLKYYVVKVKQRLHWQTLAVKQKQRRVGNDLQAMSCLCEETEPTRTMTAVVVYHVVSDKHQRCTFINEHII